MSAQAVTQRLRQMSAQFQARGFLPKGPPMDAESVTARLRLMSSLADMCLRLGAVGAAAGALRSGAGGVKGSRQP